MCQIPSILETSATGTKIIMELETNQEQILGLLNMDGSINYSNKTNESLIQHRAS